jgi:hypothetical protein
MLSYERRQRAASSFECSVAARVNKRANKSMPHGCIKTWARLRNLTDVTRLAEGRWHRFVALSIAVSFGVAQTRAHGLAATWPVQHVVADCRGHVSFHLKPITRQPDVPYSRWPPLSSLLYAPAWHGMHQALCPTAGMDGRARWCFFGRSLCIGLLDAALASFRLAADRTTRERALASVAQDSVRSDLPKHPAGMPHLSTCIPLYRVQQSLGRSVPFKFNLSSDTQAPLY